MQQKSLKTSWDANATDAPKPNQKQVPGPGIRPYANLGEKISALSSQRGFMVYDGRENYWGHAVLNVTPLDKQPDGVDKTVYRLSVIRDRQPNDGDRIALEMESGKTGLFLVLDTEKHRDPYDLTTAKAVLLDGDYKGGVGFEGRYANERSTEPFLPKVERKGPLKPR